MRRSTQKRLPYAYVSVVVQRIGTPAVAHNCPSFRTFMRPDMLRALFSGVQIGQGGGMTDTDIENILTRTKTIAVVGFSANPARPSHYVAAYLQSQGYRVIPVNPGLAGQVHLGETVYGSLADVPDTVEMVDIFRRSDAVPAVVDESLARWPSLGCIWMQLGVIHEGAAEVARKNGTQVVMDRCPKIEIPRLSLAK